MRYLGKLPSSVNGDRRNTLIHTFRLHKGMSYVPRTVHHAIEWSKKDPMLDPIANDLPWKVVPKEQMPGCTFHSDTQNNQEKGDYTRKGT